MRFLAAAILLLAVAPSRLRACSGVAAIRPEAPWLEAPLPVSYLHALGSLLWMTLIHWALLFPVTIPVTVGGLWLLLRRHSHERPPLREAD